MSTQGVITDRVEVTAGKRRLEGKVSIITGAAMGIGRAIAGAFAREGATVVLCDLNAEAMGDTLRGIPENGEEPLFVEADVSKSEDVKRVVGATISHHGRVDVLVNNAGILEPGGVTELEEDAWDRVMNVNAKGVFLCCRHVVPHMLKNGGGSIVNITSIAGLIAWPGVMGYCASKGAVTMMTRAMALDLARDRIRVNAVAPGAVWTPMVRDFTNGNEEAVHSMADQHPMGRIGRPEEIAEATVFLASDQSSFTTGVILPVDGGYTAR